MSNKSADAFRPGLGLAGSAGVARIFGHYGVRIVDGCSAQKRMMRAGKNRRYAFEDNQWANGKMAKIARLSLPPKWQ